MYGAIIGDIVGSVYEFHNIKNKQCSFWGCGHRPTDDTYMTIAIAGACMDYGGDIDIFRDRTIDEMRRIGRKYPDAGYGMRFDEWLWDDRREPYGSFGNGSAMRVSPCGWVCDTLEHTIMLAGASAVVTHSHPEGIKGAQAIAAAIFLARTGKDKETIREYITDAFGYKLSKTCDDIRPTYRFNETCPGTVPEALIAFF